MVRRYSSYLAAEGLCGTAFSRVIPVSHFRYLGSSSIRGRPDWKLEGEWTSSGGESFHQTLWVDQGTYSVARSASTYGEKLQGRVVARWNSVVDYSAFNQPISIPAPMNGASTP
jgi:hypothetical protein